jgi:hypothetical protein
MCQAVGGWLDIPVNNIARKIYQLLPHLCPNYQRYKQWSGPNLCLQKKEPATSVKKPLARGYSGMRDATDVAARSDSIMLLRNLSRA